MAGRFGGEEFLIYLSDVHPDHLSNVAEKIRLAVELGGTAGLGQGFPRQVTISIGGAQGSLLGPVDWAVQDLMEKADACLYQAKNSGRNKVVTSSL